MRPNYRKKVGLCKLYVAHLSILSFILKFARGNFHFPRFLSYVRVGNATPANRYRRQGGGAFVYEARRRAGEIGRGFGPEGQVILCFELQESKSSQSEESSKENEWNVSRARDDDEAMDKEIDLIKQEEKTFAESLIEAQLSNQEKMGKLDSLRRALDKKRRSVMSAHDVQSCANLNQVTYKRLMDNKIALERQLATIIYENSLEMLCLKGEYQTAHAMKVFGKSTITPAHWRH